MPNKTPKEIEGKIVAVRKTNGFGPKPISDIVNESIRREEKENLEDYIHLLRTTSK